MAQINFPLGNADLQNPSPTISASLATPVNSAFSTATTGGTLAAGTYYYRVTAINAVGETLPSTETSQVTTGTTSTVTVNWGAVVGATGYKIYGRSTGAELFLAQVGAVTTWTDTGSLTPSGAMPTANTTGLSSFSIIVVNAKTIIKPSATSGAVNYALTLDSKLPIGATLTIEHSASDTGAVTYGAGITALGFSGVAGKVLTKHYEFDGTSFVQLNAQIN